MKPLQKRLLCPMLIKSRRKSDQKRLLSVQTRALPNPCQRHTLRIIRQPLQTRLLHPRSIQSQQQLDQWSLLSVQTRALPAPCQRHTLWITRHPLQTRLIQRSTLLPLRTITRILSVPPLRTILRRRLALCPSRRRLVTWRILLRLRQCKNRQPSRVAAPRL